MADRFWNLRLNMDLFNGAYMKLRSDSDRLEYFLGWHLGCLDGDLSEGDSKPFQAGFEVGHAMIEEAKAFSEKQSLRGQASAESRRVTRGTAQPSRTEHRTTTEPPFEPPFDVSSNQSTIHNPQSTNEQAKEPASEQTKRARQAAFVPPSESEWVEYCTSTWPDWSAITSAESWAYYEALRPPWKGFSDWRKVARTAHGKARDWGRLQPKGSDPQAQKPEWVIRKLAELQSKLDSTERQLRRDIMDKGADSHSAGLSRKQIESIKAEMGAL